MITKGHICEVKLATAWLLVCFCDKVEEPQHLLLRRVDNQVLALGNIQLQQKLLLDALDRWHMLQLATELADVNLLNGDRFDCRAHIS